MNELAKPEKIKYCPKCEHDFDFEDEAAFCPTCGRKKSYRNPEIHVDVEIEGQGSRCMSLTEFFGIARKKGLLK